MGGVKLEKVRWLKDIPLECHQFANSWLWRPDKRADTTDNAVFSVLWLHRYHFDLIHHR